MAPNSTHDISALAARLDAVERAVADDDRNAPSADGSAREPPRSSGTDAGDSNGGETSDRDATDGRDAEIEALRERVATLEAELDAVRGLLGGVQAVEESVERRADAALAKVERLESSMAGESDLLVERVPVDDVAGDSPADENAVATDTTGATDRTPETEGAETDESDSLAGRLREAL